MPCPYVLPVYMCTCKPLYILTRTDLGGASGIVLEVLVQMMTTDTPYVAAVLYSDPLVLGMSPWRRGSCCEAASNARASALQIASALWWSLAPRTRCTC